MTLYHLTGGGGIGKFRKTLAQTDIVKYHQ
jgi:hypothetical protein